jgi:mannose-6-phosphate isomerase
MIKLPAEPLFFEPIYFEKIWGGSLLKEKFNRQITPGQLIGESWELSAFQSSQSIVSSGKNKGLSLSELTAHASEQLTGALLNQFPLLIKFIDATEKLSVQVHPGQERNDSKTECWYVADAQKDAKLILGFNEDVTREAIVSALESKSITSLLREVPIKTGEMYFIPSGTVHAIMGNSLIYEVQQTSDTTYRLYDWDRCDAQNRPRQLHIDEALEVIDMQGNLSYRIDPVRTEYNGYTHSLRVACRYFAVEEYRFFKSMTIQPITRKSFRVVTVIEGTASVRYGNCESTLEKGRTILIPGIMKEMSIFADAGSTLLVTFVPDLVEDIIESLTAKKVSTDKIIALGGASRENHIQSMLLENNARSL